HDGRRGRLREGPADDDGEIPEPRHAAGRRRARGDGGAGESHRPGRGPRHAAARRRGRRGRLRARGRGIRLRGRPRSAHHGSPAVRAAADPARGRGVVERSKTMNIFKAQAVKDPDAVTRAIPVIDVGPAFRGERGALEAAAAAVREASERVGFFYVAGHGVDPAVVAAAFDASREFHAIPLADKLALKLSQSNIGYLAVNESMQRASTVHKATRPNYNESFFISHERGDEHPDVVAGTPLRGQNQWPAGHAAMRRAMVAYFKTLEGVGERMLPILARALDLPADFFAPFFAG